jgi:hypothetical protein
VELKEGLSGYDEMVLDVKLRRVMWSSALFEKSIEVCASVWVKIPPGVYRHDAFRRDLADVVRKTFAVTLTWVNSLRLKGPAIATGHRVNIVVCGQPFVLIDDWL